MLGINTLVLPIGLAFLQSAFAARVTLPTPLGSGTFGSSVTTLPNSNIVVTDPGFNDPVTGVTRVGAAHLFSPTGVLISTLRGATVNDTVGRKIIVLANGNYLVASSSWGSLDQGALTFCRADIGCESVVSAANSLIGSQNADGVGACSTLHWPSRKAFCWQQSSLLSANAPNARCSGRTAIASALNCSNRSR